MNLVGSLSPFIDDTVTLNGKLNPVHATWMKVQVKNKDFSVSMCSR